MILVHRDKKYLSECKNKIKKLCNDLLDLELNEKTQIGMVKNGIDFLGYRHILSSSGKIGIDFLGYRHILSSSGKIIIKLRYSSKNV